MARTVLLADDSVTAQNMGRRILTDAGYEVITVNNGSAALKKVHESQPDLIVLDVYMPGYGGLEVCQRLKESGETMRIPVLLTVGKMEPFKSDEAKRVRADGHIVKPFEASELLAALTKLEDRIVPAAARKGKADKKSRTERAGEEEPQTPTDWTDRVAYLAQAKQRVVNPEPEPAVEEVVAPRRVKQATPAEPTVEMQVVADALTESASSRAVEQPPVTETKAEPREPEVQDQSASTEKVEASASVVEAESTRENKPAVEIKAEADLQTAAPSAKPHWIAENVPLSAEEAALELEREMQQSQLPAAPPQPVAATSEQSSGSPEKAEPEREAAERNGATFAAAASASSSAASASTSLPSSGAASAIASQVTEQEDTEPAGLDAAAAWKNWEQIRESVMSARNSGDIEAAISAITNVASSAPEISAMPAAAEASGDASAAPLQGEALASIVDSVLAELKPKLMEQIAKKLANEKK